MLSGPFGVEDRLDADRIDYQKLLQESLRDALRAAVRRVLARVAEEGLPGEHFFYIGFRTDRPGIEIPRFLRDQYPEEMTVVLQNQFWDLAFAPAPRPPARPRPWWRRPSRRSGWRAAAPRRRST
jgi:stringent starvation protein B